MQPTGNATRPVGAAPAPRKPESMVTLMGSVMLPVMPPVKGERRPETRVRNLVRAGGWPAKKKALTSQRVEVHTSKNLGTRDCIVELLEIFLGLVALHQQPCSQGGPAASGCVALSNGARTHQIPKVGSTHPPTALHRSAAAPTWLEACPAAASSTSPAWSQCMYLCVMGGQ